MDMSLLIFFVEMFLDYLFDLPKIPNFTEQYLEAYMPSYAHGPYCTGKSRREGCNVNKSKLCQRYRSIVND